MGVCVALWTCYLGSELYRLGEEHAFYDLSFLNLSVYITHSLIIYKVQEMGSLYISVRCSVKYLLLH